jgi:hypothetical protein
MSESHTRESARPRAGQLLSAFGWGKAKHRVWLSCKTRSNNDVTTILASTNLPVRPRLAALASIPDVPDLKIRK